MSERIKKRDVRIEAFEKRYRGGHKFYAMPPMDPSIDNYVTGQEYRRNRPDGLTKGQIEGVDKLSDKQRAKYPYAIVMSQFFRGEPIYKGMSLDLSTYEDDGEYVNKKDHAIYNFIVEGQSESVASSLSDCKVGVHSFYFIDRVKDAKARVNSKRQYVKAIKLIDTELDVDSYYELLLYINYYHEQSYIVGETNVDLLEDLINDICEKHTEGVIRFFDEHSQSQLFVLKLIYKGILSLDNGAIVDKKGAYIGSNPEEVIAYTKKKKNNLKMVHWRKALAKEDIRFAKEVEASKEEK